MSTFKEELISGFEVFQDSGIKMVTYLDLKIYTHFLFFTVFYRSIDGNATPLLWYFLYPVNLPLNIMKKHVDQTAFSFLSGWFLVTQR